MRLSQHRLAAVLKKHGYRLTPQRRAIIETVALSRGHLTAAAVYGKLEQNHPGIGLVTVYRTLEIMANLGLICRVHSGGCNSYTASASGNHHHLVCGGCGLVVDFSRHNLTALEKKLCRETGFTIDGRLLEFSGLCRACQAAGEPA